MRRRDGGAVGRPRGIPVEPVEPLYTGNDVDYDELDPSRAKDEYEQLIEEWRLADAAAAHASLDDTFLYDNELYARRLVYLHLIGEYARHCGHADIVREHLDGVTGA